MKVGTFLKARLEHTLNGRRTPSDIKAIQQRKFRRLVATVYEHSPYYRELMAERGIDPASCQPADFPPMTKADLSTNFDRIVTDRRITQAGIEVFLKSTRDPGARYLGDYVVITSTGTLGAVTHCVFSETEWARGMANAMRSFPFSLRRRKIAFYGLMWGHQGAATSAAASRRSLAQLRFVSRSFDAENPIEQICEQMTLYQPDILIGQPSALIELARAKEAGLLRISPGVLSVGGDTLPPPDRALLDRAFGATISNHYGSSEHLTMGYGLSKDGGVYLLEDELIFEIEEGRVLITNLFKYSQPLIRYVMDDRLEPMDCPDPSLPFTKVGEIGRRPDVDPVFSDANGADVTLPADLIVDFAMPGVERIQLRVFDKTSCLLRVKLGFGLEETERAEVLKRVEAWLTDVFRSVGIEGVSRSVEEVRSFAGRKVRFVVLPGMVDTMSDDWKHAHSSSLMA